jgi:pimeloyl-ACP methyl ester carboxylesterase
MIDQDFSEHLEIHGAPLYVEATGGGPSLLFIHAGVADCRMWQDQVGPLSAHHRVIRCDLRGFGKSPVPAGPFSNVEDVLGILDALDAKQVVCIGSSFGARVVVDFALSYPERVRALVLAAPSISGEEPSSRIEQFWEDEEAYLARGDLEAATELNLQLWVDGPYRTPDQVDPIVRERVRAMQLNVFQVPVPDGAEVVSPQEMAMDRLSELRMPTLLISGALDLEEKVTLAEQVAQSIPHARHQIVDNAAHLVNMEQPQRFNRAVLEFLEELES